MTPRTPAVVLAWKIAAFEARHVHAPNIEKEHLFIGLLSLDKTTGRKDFVKEAGIADNVSRERDAIHYLLSVTGLNATVLRRLLRQVLKKGSPPSDNTVIHRSPDCKTYFKRASVLANGESISCVHLFSAIMERPGEIICGVLTESRRCVAAERETDILMPASTGVLTTGRKSIKKYDLKSALSADLNKTRDVLSLVPRNSSEHALLKSGLVKKTISLALIALDENDAVGLLSALQDLLPWSGNYRISLEDLAAGLEQSQKKNPAIHEQDKKQVYNLLMGLEQQESKAGILPDTSSGSG